MLHIKDEGLQEGDTDALPDIHALPVKNIMENLHNLTYNPYIEINNLLPNDTSITDSDLENIVNNYPKLILNQFRN